MNTSSPSSDTSNSYYVVERGQKKGPLAISVLETMHQEGTVSETTLIWTEGMADWEPAKKVVPQIFFRMVTVADQPEPERATLQIARPKWRFLSGLIDFCILFFPMQIVIFALATVTFGLGFLGELILPCVNCIYAAVMISSAWQGTVGMKLLGLKVVDYTGRKPSTGRCWGRGAASILSWMVFGIGYLLLFFTERRQTLHDMMAGTLVVRPK